MASGRRVWTSAVLHLPTLLACAGAGLDEVTVWMSWLCCKALTWIPDCWPESGRADQLSELANTGFVATPGVSGLPFSRACGQAKCWGTPWKRTSWVRAVPQPAAIVSWPRVCRGRFSSRAQRTCWHSLSVLLASSRAWPGLWVSQLEQQLTLLMLHQRRPGSLSLYQVVFPKNAQLEGCRARC